MKHLSIIQTAACAALIVAALSPRAVKADEWDKKTVLTFSDSVQVPGAVLPAGKYIFKLLESSSNRYVVQVFNERENHVFATIMAIPNYKLDTPEKTQISFYEAPVGQPEPVRAWFYPGDNFGREFVYNKHEAALIAQAGDQNVRTDETATVAENITPAENSEINTTETQAQQSAAVATEPEVESNKPVEASEPAPVAQAAPAVAEPEPQTTESPRSDETATEEQQPVDATPAADTTSSMPSTGSEMPMVLLVGLISIAGAMSVRAARRVN